MSNYIPPFPSKTWIRKQIPYLKERHGEIFGEPSLSDGLELTIRFVENECIGTALNAIRRKRMSEGDTARVSLLHKDVFCEEIRNNLKPFCDFKLEGLAVEFTEYVRSGNHDGTDCRFIAEETGDVYIEVIPGSRDPEKIYPESDLPADRSFTSSSIVIS